MRWVRFLVWSAVLIARPVSAVSCFSLATCEPADNPCIIGESCTVTPVAGIVTFDLGARDLVIQSNKVFEMIGEGTLQIAARNVTLQAGSDLRASGTGVVAATISIVASGDFTMQTAGTTKSRIDVNATDVAGTLVIEASGLALNGQILASASNTYGSGGTVDLTARLSSITLGPSADAQIDARGGEEGDGGFVDLFATQTIAVDASIKVARGNAGDIVLQTVEGDITTSTVIQASATGYFGSDGGAVEMYSGRHVTIGALVDVHGNGGQNEDSGFGGELAVEALGDVTLGASIIATGDSGGDGGIVDVLASGSILLPTSGAITLDGNGYFAAGGDVSLVADGGVTTVGNIVSTGSGSGGTAYLEGGTGQVVSVAGVLRTNGTLELSAPGSVEIFACNAQISGVISNIGPLVPPGAVTTVVSARTLNLSGSMTAFGSTMFRVAGPATFTAASSVASKGTGSVTTIEWLNAPPTIVAGAAFTPLPLVNAVANLDMSLPCCGVCAASTTTTAPSTTTTSTSLGATTTSTSLGATTTTSSTLSVTTTLPTTTTSTMLVTTTTTTQPPVGCLDMPLVGFDAIDCRVGLLQQVVQTESVETLGGVKRARHFGVLVQAIAKALGDAKAGTRAARNLKRGAKKLDALGRYATSAEKRGAIEGILADTFRTLAGDAASRMRAAAATI